MTQIATTKAMIKKLLVAVDENWLDKRRVHE